MFKTIFDLFDYFWQFSDHFWPFVFYNFDHSRICFDHFCLLSFTIFDNSEKFCQVFLLFSDHFLPILTILTPFNHLNFFDNFWPLLTIWTFLTIFSHFWPFLTMPVHFWECLTIFDGVLGGVSAHEVFEKSVTRRLKAELQKFYLENGIDIP